MTDPTDRARRSLGSAENKIRVLVIDDSAVMRQLLSALLGQDEGIEVVGVASDPFIARQKIKALKPDVLTLDVEMPGMDGLTFLDKLMRLHPMPVVMVSSTTRDGAASTLRAMELGAVDFVAKPQADVRTRIGDIAEELCVKVRTAANAHVHYRPDTTDGIVSKRRSCHPTIARSNRVIVIGASAGGTVAIKEILQKLPLETPGILVVQHMPPRFTAYFAERLNEHCALTVSEAKDGDVVMEGTALIAPGGYQMILARSNGAYHVQVTSDAPVNLHCPSVDVLFDSAARCAGANALGIILTGMGSDGASGLCDMKRAGAHTIAQDEATSLIFGMPERAIRQGGVCSILALDKIPEDIVRWAGIDP